MALIECPDCARQVSDRAAACLNCGYPLAEMERAEYFDSSSGGDAWSNSPDGSEVFTGLEPEDDKTVLPAVHSLPGSLEEEARLRDEARRSANEGCLMLGGLISLVFVVASLFSDEMNLSDGLLLSAVVMVAALFWLS